MVAPLGRRIENIMNLMAAGKEEAAHLVKRRDHEQARLVRDFFDCDVEDPTLYDLVIDSSEVPMDEAAAQVFDLVADRART
jgi:cytidylate kinase